MKISHNWLKDFIELDLSVEDIADLLTRLGLEVEAIEYPDDFSKVVVGLVESCERLPEGRNHYCEVNVGREKLKTVCGAPNVKLGILVPVVLPGGKLPGGQEITTATVAGKTSAGMICSQAELMLGGQSEVIWELDKDLFASSIAVPGMDLREKIPRDAVFKLEVTHNRADCLSHLGVARDLAAGLGLEMKYTPHDVEEIDSPTDMALSVEIRDPVRCPRYCGRVVENVTVTDSPRWMQRRLMAVGLRPINNIVDVTNYVLMEYGHPLHAFDFNLIVDNIIVVKTALEGEKFITLDEKEYVLTKGDLLICDGEKAVALAGVMGGINSEIQDETVDILLECAYFNPLSIRRTSKRHGLVTDSSYRFERGVDPNAVPTVIDRAAHLVRETAGGVILSGRVDNYPHRFLPAKTKLRPKRVNHILGSRIKSEQMAHYLTRLGLKTSPVEKGFDVEIPTFRPDLIEEIDLVEEIARLHGYDKVQTVNRANISLEVEPLIQEDFDHTIKSALVESGMFEVLTHSMRRARRAGLGIESPVAIKNPISADFALLRTDLFAPLLEVASHNLNHGSESVRIFELGHVFAGKAKEEVDEKKRFAGLLAGRAEESHWSSKVSDFDFFNLKGLLENFLRRISMDNYQFSSYIGEEEFYEYAQSILVLGELGGALGELKREIAEGFEIDIPVFLFAFDYDVLLEHRQPIRQYSAFSRLPTVRRDLSLLFDEGIIAKEIEKSIYERGGKFLKRLEFFDIYHGRQVEPGKKSVSFALQFQAEDRTLTDAEVDKMIDDIVIGLKKISGELRKL